MMGEREPQAPLLNYRVNLDKRVRRDHPLRRINEVLDLSFVRAQVGHTYGRRGNKSELGSSPKPIANLGARLTQMRHWSGKVA
jgi:hypothetical protein